MLNSNHFAFYLEKMLMQSFGLKCKFFTVIQKHECILRNYMYMRK